MDGRQTTGRDEMKRLARSHQTFRLPMKIEMRFANALDGSA
jgi:hypothetical protein